MNNCPKVTELQLRMKDVFPLDSFFTASHSSRRVQFKCTVLTERFIQCTVFAIANCEATRLMLRLRRKR